MNNQVLYTYIFLQTQPALYLTLGRCRNAHDASRSFWYAADCVPVFLVLPEGLKDTPSLSVKREVLSRPFVCVFDVCTKFLKVQVLRLLWQVSPLVRQCKIVLKVEHEVRTSVYLPSFTEEQ